MKARNGAYKKTYLWANQHGSEALIEWGEGGWCDPHGHSCRGEIEVIEGALCQMLWLRDTEKFLGRRIFRAGDKIAETTNTIHSIRKWGKGKTVSHHRYYGNLKMTYYSLKELKT